MDISKEALERISELISYDNYNEVYREKTYQNYCDRYDDCFEAGFNKGYSKAIYDLVCIVNGKEIEDDWE